MRRTLKAAGNQSKMQMSVLASVLPDRPPAVEKATCTITATFKSPDCSRVMRLQTVMAAVAAAENWERSKEKVSQGSVFSCVSATCWEKSMRSRFVFCYCFFTRRKKIVCFWLWIPNRLTRFCCWQVAGVLTLLHTQTRKWSWITASRRATVHLTELCVQQTDLQLVAACDQQGFDQWSEILMNYWDDSVWVTLDLSSLLLMSILQNDNPARGSQQQRAVCESCYSGSFTSWCHLKNKTQIT